MASKIGRMRREAKNISSAYSGVVAIRHSVSSGLKSDIVTSATTSVVVAVTALIPPLTSISRSCRRPSRRVSTSEARRVWK